MLSAETESIERCVAHCHAELECEPLRPLLIPSLIGRLTRTPSASATMVVLVQELFDTIIDEVGAKKPRDYATLWACSLTARAFAERSQRNLFHSFTLKDTGRTAIQAAAALIDSPHIASYIRDLHIQLGFYNDSLRTPLTALFPLLSNICRLGISSPYVDWHWNTLPVSFRAALVGLLSTPSLRCLALAKCTGVPSSIIRHALLSYRELTLNTVGILLEDEVFPYADELQAKSPSSPIPLDLLAVSYTQNFEQAGLLYAVILADTMVTRLHHLRHLELHILETRSLGPLEILAVKSAESLEHLVIHSRSRSAIPL